MEQERIIEIENILTEAHFQFAMKCLYRFMMIMPKNDIAFNPHSIYEGLLSIYLMSSGAIEERLKLILCLSNVRKYDLIQYYLLGRDFEQSENNASAASSDYDAERRCWIKATKFNHSFPLKKSIFNNKFEVFDPDDTPIEKIDRINMAIQSATENYIRFPVKFREVKDDMELVLMTVSRLNVQKFQISTMSESDAKGVQKVDERKRKSWISDELGMLVGEFPYTNENRSLFMFIPGSIIPGGEVRRLPVVNDPICDLIERFSTEEGICTLRNLLDNDTPSEDDQDYSKGPIFDLETDMPMRALLRDLGIEELLKPDAINLDSFFVDDDSVHLGNAVHRTHVKVTKEDTVAGSVNVIYTGQEDYHVPFSDSNKISQHYYFPFVWLIYDKQRRNVLFAGAFNKNRSLDLRGLGRQLESFFRSSLGSTRVGHTL